MTEFVSISDFRKKIKFFIEEVVTGKKRIVLQKHKRPVAALSPLISDSNNSDDIERCEKCGRSFGEEAE